MLDLVFGTAQAYQQVGLFMGALVCFGLGALIIGDSIYWHVHAVRVTGTIIGVVAEGGMYAPVYRYTSPDGRTREAESNISSGTAAGKQTGRVVPLLVFPNNPARAQEAGIRSAELIVILVGLVMVLTALWIGYTAITAYPVTPMTWIMAACVPIYVGWHLRRGVIPKGQRLSLQEWRREHNLGEAASIDLSRVKPIEQIVSAADVARTAEQQSRQSRTAAPIVGLLAVVLVGVAIQQGAQIARLEAIGLRAQGKVIGLKSEFSSGSSTYHAIVRYRTEKNALVEFKDSIGTNPPSHRMGDKVTVLYLADDPKGAIIDRGVFWNWAIPVLLLAGAVLLSWLLLAMLRTGRQGAAVGRPAPSGGPPAGGNPDIGLSSSSGRA
jgi:hypothetical protein